MYLYCVRWLTDRRRKFRSCILDADSAISLYGILSSSPGVVGLHMYLIGDGSAGDLEVDCELGLRPVASVEAASVYRRSWTATINEKINAWFSRIGGGK